MESRVMFENNFYLVHDIEGINLLKDCIIDDMYNVAENISEKLKEQDHEEIQKLIIDGVETLLNSYFDQACYYLLTGRAPYYTKKNGTWHKEY